MWAVSRETYKQREREREMRTQHNYNTRRRKRTGARMYSNWSVSRRSGWRWRTRLSPQQQREHPKTRRREARQHAKHVAGRAAASVILSYVSYVNVLESQQRDFYNFKYSTVL